jgi:hypothetical protein
MAQKVYSVYGRNGYEGPWTFINWYVGKRDAEDERSRLRYHYSETKLLREFDYEARSRRR